MPDGLLSARARQLIHLHSGTRGTATDAADRSPGIGPGVLSRGSGAASCGQNGTPKKRTKDAIVTYYSSKSDGTPEPVQSGARAWTKLRHGVDPWSSFSHVRALQNLLAYTTGVSQRPVCTARVLRGKRRWRYNRQWRISRTERMRIGIKFVAALLML